MKKGIKILSLCMLLPLAFAVSCGEKTPEKEETARKTSTIENDLYESTGEYLYKDGTSAYKVVVPQNATSYESLAASEFSEFIYQATGYRYQVVTEDTITYTADGHFIMFGETQTASTLGVEADSAELKLTGYTLQTKDKSVFLVGAGEKGTAYGAYDFLTALVGFRVYADDEIYVNKGVTEIELKKYDFSFRPTIENRQNLWTNIVSDPTYSNRMKSAVDSEVWVKIGGINYHTTEKLVPSSLRGEHPSWFGTDGNQLCFSEGLENEEMFNYLYANYKQYIDDQPNAKYASISQMDKTTWCECERCVASKQYYGSNLAVLVKFCNKVAKQIQIDYPDRELYVHTFSYHETSAPVTAHFEELTCEPNVTIMFAPIRANFTQNFEHSSNEQTLKALQSLSKFCSHITVWTYDVHFMEVFLNYNTFTGRVERYKTMDENNVGFLLEQALYRGTGITSFGSLKAFLTATLSWDASLDYNALVDEYFERYFQDGAKAMRKFFEAQTSWSTYACDYLGYSWDCNATQNLQAQFFPRAMVNQWMQYFDEAYEAIEYLKWTNPALYERAYGHIVKESLSPRYLLIELYGSNFPEDKLLEMKRSFKADCVKYSISYITEYDPIDSVFNSWGV